jgi:hypothetical protein
LHQPELQALAIHTSTTYVESLPNFSRNETEIFLDFEGIPERRFYYLFGAVVKCGDVQNAHSFWASSIADEKDAWLSLLNLLERYPKAPIYHYGRYEPDAIRKLGERHGGSIDEICKRCVNVNALVYAQVYFPVYTNGLKDICHFLGFKWSEAEASSVSSMIWRFTWELDGNVEDKERLVNYNIEDCHALRLLVDVLTDLAKDAKSTPTVRFAHDAERQSTDEGTRLHESFNKVLVSAHANFKYKAIKTKQREKSKLKGGATRGPKAVREKPQRSVEVLPGRKCPTCIGNNIYISKRIAEAVVIDLAFSRNGCRKTVTRYWGYKIRCRDCDGTFNPPRLARGKCLRHGDALVAWAMCQRVVLRLPYKLISQAAGDLFCLSLSESTLVDFIPRVARRCEATKSNCVKTMMSAPALYVDETRMSIRGADFYVWVITDGDRVAFELTETRESGEIREVLEPYDGVVVSDFYAGYDAFPNRQQKCWSHLIGDLNDDLWKEPFNKELEAFCGEVGDLIVPIIHDAKALGLKTRRLGKKRR